MILDIVIILLVALSVYLGYKKGLINLALKFVTLVISLVVTVVLFNPIANFIINVTSIDDAIENHIYEKVSNVMVESNSPFNYLGITKEQVEGGMLPSAARKLATDIVRFAIFIILLIALKFGLRFISALANHVATWSIISRFNKVGGGLYGVLRGVLVVFLVLFVVQLITKIEPTNVANTEIEKSYITKVMYENNPVSLLL